MIYDEQNIWENRPPGPKALLFSISGTGSFIWPVAQTWLNIPSPLITQSHRHGWTYQGLWLPSHTDTAGHTLWLPSHSDTAGHTKAFDHPVTQTRLDIPMPLITQSHRHGWTYPLITQSLRHGWTYQGLWSPSHTDTAGCFWLPSHTGTAGHTNAFDYPVTQTRLDIPFDYPVTQTRLDIPRPLITQSHRHGWTYQGLWLPNHTDKAGHTKALDYPVTQTRLDIPRPLITQSHKPGWTYQGLWLPSHTDTAGHTKVFDYPVTQTRLDIPRPLITQSHRYGWTYQGLWLPSHRDTAGHTEAFDYPVAQTRLDIPRPLFTQSHRHGWTYQGLWLPSDGPLEESQCRQLQVRGCELVHILAPVYQYIAQYIVHSSHKLSVNCTRTKYISSKQELNLTLCRVTDNYQPKVLQVTLKSLIMLFLSDDLSLELFSLINKLGTD